MQDIILNAEELRRRIARAQQRLEQSRSDAEYNANDDLLAHWQRQLRDLDQAVRSSPRGSSPLFSREQLKAPRASSPGASSYSGMQPASGAAADLRRSSLNAGTSVLRCSGPSASRPRRPTPPITGAAADQRREFLEMFTVLLGMTVFGTIAYVLMMAA